MKAGKRTITIGEVSDALGISKQTLWRWAKDGRLPVIQGLGHKILISRDAFELLFSPPGQGRTNEHNQVSGLGSLWTFTGGEKWSVR